MSGGAMIWPLAADEIAASDIFSMRSWARSTLSWVSSATSILKAVGRKRIDRVDATLIMADMAEKAMRQVEDFTTGLLEDKFLRKKRANSRAR